MLDKLIKDYINIERRKINFNQLQTLKVCASHFEGLTMCIIFRSLLIFTVSVLAIEGRFFDQINQGEREAGLLKYLVNLISSHPEHFSSFYRNIISLDPGRVPDKQHLIPMPFNDECTQCAVSNRYRSTFNSPVKPVADLRGRQGRAPPGGPNFFMQFSAIKIG